MNCYLKINDVDVVILCGGRGTRLRPLVKDRPKGLAEINGKPFLDILIDYLANFGFKRFILCIGYLGQNIKQHYQNQHSSLKILFSEEKKPLGTAGAVKNAEPLIKSNPFLVLNGDSFCRINLYEFINFYIRKKALVSIALTKAKRASAYGAVSLSPSQQILTFDEKVKQKHNCFINAGIYLFENRVFSMIPDKENFSLEYNLFPKIINKKFYGYVTEERVIDIGTPVRLRDAEVILRS